MMSLLSLLLGADALLAVGFGVASWLSPLGTFGTLIDLSNPDAVLLSALGSLSVFYVLIGLVCACAVFLPEPHRARLAAVMLLRHAWIGVKGLGEVGSDWLIGDPWPDIAIHAAFAAGYLVAIVVPRLRRQQ